MKTLARIFMVLVLPCAITLGQAPIEVIDGFNWPDPVAREMARVTQTVNQTSIASYAQTVDAGYNTVTKEFVKYPVLPSGYDVNIWRVDHDNTSYYLMTHRNDWYWTSRSELERPNKVQASSQSEIYGLPEAFGDKLAVKFQASYWDSYGDESSLRTKMGLYTDVKIHLGIIPGYFELRPGFGLSSLQKSADNGLVDSYNATRIRLAEYWQVRLFGSDWLRLESYASFSQYWPESADYDQKWSLYSKTSWISPRSSVGLFRLAFTNYQTQPSTGEWGYSEDRLQILYSPNKAPKLFIGVEPIIGGRWENDSDWETITRDKPGSLLIATSISGHWLELRYGQLQKKSGMLGDYEVTKEKHLSLTVNAKLF
ncbi:hypothetical protein ISR92_02195 [Patescibacteria group bacterium]|nr:hypothetical protein [Patescibacteria group bacterium]